MFLICHVAESIICNEEHFVRDFPHCTEVSKFLKTSNASVVLTNPFPNPDTNMVATNPASISQVLMLSITKPKTDVFVSMKKKYYDS